MDLRMQAKPSLVVEPQRPEDGAGPLVKIAAKIHLLPMVGLWFPHLPLEASLVFLTAYSPFVSFPGPTLLQMRQCPCLLPPIAHYVLLTATLGTTSVCLNL